MALPVCAEAASSGADFLKIGVGARAAGLGGAYTAVADDTSAIYWNPAGLGLLLKKEASGTHSELPFGTRYDFLGYVHPMSRGTLVLTSDATGLASWAAPAGGGAWVKIAEETLSTDSDSFAPITGLNLEADRVYRLFLLIQSAGSTDPDDPDAVVDAGLFYNTGTIEADYLTVGDSHFFDLGTNTASSNPWGAKYPLIGYGYTLGGGSADVVITKLPNMPPYAASRMSAFRTGRGGHTDSITHIWYNNFSNVTQMQVKVASNTSPSVKFKAGSRLILLRPSN